MSKDLFDQIKVWVRDLVAAELKKWRPDLRKTTGAIPGNQLPTTGNTGTGYTPTAHDHDAGDIVSGTLDTARLGSGTADSTTFLRGDQTWAAPTAAPSAHNHTSALGDGGVLTNDEHDGYSVYQEIAAPGAPDADTIRLYAKDVAGLTELFYQASNGIERSLSSPTLASHNHTALGGDGGVLTNDAHDGYSDYIEIAEPSGPSINTLRLYAKDLAGLTELFYKNSAGTERQLANVAIGSYTPTYLGGTTPGTTTYTVQVGRYQRVGDFCHFMARVDWTNATGTGVAQISLPFTAKNTANQAWPISVYTIGVTFAVSTIQALISPNVAVAVLNSPTSNGGSNLVAVETAGTIILAGTYEVA